MSVDETQPDGLEGSSQVPDGQQQPLQDGGTVQEGGDTTIPSADDGPLSADGASLPADDVPLPVDDAALPIDEASLPADAEHPTIPEPTTEPFAEAELSVEVEPPPEAPPAPQAFRYDEKYYQPVSAESPTGTAVEFYHFAEMDQDLAWPVNDFGRPDPDERPNFRAVREKALGFLDGSKEIPATRDVRPMLALAIAEAGDKGPVGFAKALDLFVSTSMSHWEAIHPQKEDDDDDELMTRMEEIRKYLNPTVISLAVESVGIARSPRVGDLTTRTFGIATTKVSPREGEFAPNAEALTTLLSEEDDVRTSIGEALAAYRSATEQLRTFEAFLESHPDVDPVDLAGIAEALEKQAAFIEPFLDESGEGGTATGADAGNDGQIDAVGGVAMSSAPISGPNTLPEAMELLDDVLRFYARSGRSSPVPLGLIALRDLMAGDFNTWINQTVSSGLSEAAINLSGVDASRLSSFASGDAPAAAAPVSIDLDFSEINRAISDAEEAYYGLDVGLNELRQKLPPEEGESESTVLVSEFEALRTALDQIRATKREIEAGPTAQVDDSQSSNNALEGDAHHSRITDRSGVKVALDAVAAYFEREEPSSPAPAYLRRLRSLVDARFTDIARELMPEDGGEAKLRLEPKTNLR